MWVFAVFMLYLGIAALFIYTLLCGESEFHRHGIIGKLHYFMTQWAPRLIRNMLRRVVGETLYKRASSFFSWCVYGRNPALQILYVILMGGGIIVFLFEGYPFLPMHHRIGCWITVVSIFGIYIATCRADPGIITKDNARHYVRAYEYDNVVYRKKDCRTCTIPRPARSKHCSVCDHCVARFDHHCPWINGCVGAANLRYFLLFLVATAWTCLYCCYACGCIMYYNIYIGYGLEHATYRGEALSYVLLLKLVIHYAGAMLVGLMFFTFMTGMAVLGFFLYHCYLIARNVTTTETFKYETAKMRYHLTMMMMEKNEALDDPATRDKLGAEEPSGDIDGDSGESEQKNGGKEGPEQKESNGGKEKEKKRWKLVQMTDGKEEEKDVEPLYEPPVNTYYRGIVGNFQEVLFPSLPQHNTRKRR